MPDTKYFSNVQSKSTGEVYVVKDKDARDQIANKADNTPTFTEASTRANIASGETMPTILGKIKKFFTDLKAVAFSGSYNDLSNKPTIPAAANNGTLTIQKNGTNVQTFTANQSTNATANITVPTALSDLTADATHRLVTDTEKSTWNGKATTTDITNAINALDVASVGGTGKYISAISEADGKISATATSIANINPLIAPYEAYLQWGGQNFTGSYGCIDAAMVSDLNANRFFGIRAAGISIEYTRDGGTTWIDYGASDTAKQALFTNGTAFYIGKADSSNKATANGTKYQLRVTLDTATSNVYTELKKIVLYISTNGSASCTCKVQGVLKENSSDTGFIDITSDVSISGWSGYNVINTSFVAGNSFNGQYRKVRFLFKANGGQTNYVGLNVQRIMAYGGVGWTTPSTMAQSGHLYVADSNLKATFPAELEATALYENGTALSSKYAAKSDIPTVNNGTLTIQKNGTNVQTFTANQSTNATANITVPTALSGLTDDATHRVVTDTEKSTWNGKATTTDITNAINALDVSSVGGSGKYISAISETDGKISATATNFPTIPAAANNGTLTIQKNGTNVQTFTANQSTNVTANITVPTALSGLTDDATHRLVTDTEKSTWNGKADVANAVTNGAVGLVNASDGSIHYFGGGASGSSLYVTVDNNGNPKIRNQVGSSTYSELSGATLSFVGSNKSLDISAANGIVGSGNDSISYNLTRQKLSYLNNITSDVQAQINGKAASSHTHNYAGSSSAGGSANSAVYANTINATYSGNGGKQGPSYFGKNRLGSLMSNQTINGDTGYKNWIYMDGYDGTDVGGASAIGVDRYYGSNTTPRAFIMTSDANRTSWNASAELITTSNVGSYTGGTKLYLHKIFFYSAVGDNSSLGLRGAASLGLGSSCSIQEITYNFGGFDRTDFGLYMYLICSRSAAITTLDQLATTVANENYVRWDNGNDHNMTYTYKKLYKYDSTQYRLYGLGTGFVSNNSYNSHTGRTWSNAKFTLYCKNWGALSDTVTAL